MLTPQEQTADGETWGRLMAAAQDGDRAAYTLLLQEILPFVRGIIRRHHATPDRVDDVVQDVLLCVHRVRHTYDPSRPFRHWVAAIARRRSIDALRRRTRIDAVERAAGEDYETFPDPQANREMEATQDAGVLKDAVAALPLGQRRAVELLRLQELSLADAARASGQSEGALKVSLHRAIRGLRKILSEGRNGPD
jgi:RNA polymerase sigma-70 factor (ECF subfamily)